MKNIKKLTLKMLAVCLIALLVTACKKENKGFTIEGTVDKSFALDSIHLYDSGAKVLFSAPVKEGKFTLTGNTEHVRKLILGNADKNLQANLILENDNYNVVFNKDGSSEIKGGKTHQLLFKHYEDPEFKKLVKEYEENTEKAFDGIDMENEEQVTKAREIMFTYEEKVRNYEDKVFQEIKNGDYPEIAKMHVFLLNPNMELEDLQKEIAKFEKNFGNHPDLISFKKNVEEDIVSRKAQEEVANGKPFKEIIAKDINGKEIKLSEVVKNNKFTILEFWASWCGPCRAEIPNLKKAYAKYKGKGLEIYSISVDSKTEHWTKALEEEKTVWVNVLSANNFNDKYVADYGIQGIPASFLISQDGTIIASNDELREFNLDKTLSQHIK